MSTDYVAGPMTDQPKLNFPMFDEVAAAWRRKGNQVINPADHDRHVAAMNGVDCEKADGFLEGDVSRYHVAIGSTMEGLLGWDLIQIIAECDGIILLPGWEKSKGAGHEKYVAEATGKDIRYAYRTPQGHWLFLDFDLCARQRMSSVKSAVPLHHRDPEPVLAGMKLNESFQYPSALRPVSFDIGQGGSFTKMNDPYKAGINYPSSRLIGLMGYAQSGKDTVAKLLVDEYGYERLAFADILRDCLYALNPTVTLTTTYNFTDFWDLGAVALQRLVDAKGWEGAKQEPEVRALLQRLGTEVGRQLLGENVWVDAAMRKVEGNKRVVITDVRFPNEVQAVRDAGGTLWRIQRPGKGPVNNHPSETAVDAVREDYRLFNDGSIESLYATIRFDLARPAVPLHKRSFPIPEVLS